MCCKEVHSHSPNKLPKLGCDRNSSKVLKCSCMQLFKQDRDGKEWMVEVHISKMNEYELFSLQKLVSVVPKNCRANSADHWTVIVSNSKMKFNHWTVKWKKLNPTVSEKLRAAVTLKLLVTPPSHQLLICQKKPFFLLSLFLCKEYLISFTKSSN